MIHRVGSKRFHHINSPGDSQFLPSLMLTTKAGVRCLMRLAQLKATKIWLRCTLKALAEIQSRAIQPRATTSPSYTHGRLLYLRTSLEFLACRQQRIVRLTTYASSLCADADGSLIIEKPTLHQSDDRIHSLPLKLPTKPLSIYSTRWSQTLMFPREAPEWSMKA